MLQKGTTLAGYRIDGVLGQGGMGTVYEANQLSLDRVVALKLLAAHLSDDIQFRERFRREGQIQARLEHPHIVTVYEAGETEHGLFIAMRLVRGRTLKDLVNARELDVDRTLKILAPVAEALDEAHAIGLIHRDIKPQNVLVGRRDHSFLADFGLTKGTTETSLTRTGHFVGTWDYIPPEQINGLRATSASDIYSLTAVLYECLTGQVPYPKPAEAAVLYAHVSDPPPRPTAQNPELPARLDEIVARGMAKEPAERHASAGELIEEVRGAFAVAPPVVEPEPLDVTRARPVPPAPGELTAPAPTARPVRTPPRPAPGPVIEPPARPAEPARRPPPTRRSPAALPLLAVGGLLAVVVAGFLIGRGSSGGDSTPDSGQAVSTGDLTVHAPAGWKRAPEPRQIRGLPLRNAASLLGAGGKINVGTSGATGSAMVPPALLRGAPSDPETVELGDLDALRYADLEPKSPAQGTLRVYAVPIKGAVATVACVIPPDASTDSLSGACDTTADSLQVENGRRVYPIGPDDEYQAVLDAAIKRLNKTTAKGSSALRRAKTAKAQASAANDLSVAYAGAAESLRGATGNPQVMGANRDIVVALNGLASDYRRLATAARAEDQGRYDAVRRAIDRGERSLSRALQSVEA
jgi:protein kinase-like protein